MQQFIIMFVNLWRAILDKLSSTVFTFSLYGKNVNISLTMILFTGLVFSIIIGVFWKGARA